MDTEIFQILTAAIVVVTAIKGLFDTVKSVAKERKDPNRSSTVNSDKNTEETEELKSISEKLRKLNAEVERYITNKQH